MRYVPALFIAMILKEKFSFFPYKDSKKNRKIVWEIFWIQNLGILRVGCRTSKLNAKQACDKADYSNFKLKRNNTFLIWVVELYKWWKVMKDHQNFHSLQQPLVAQLIEFTDMVLLSFIKWLLSDMLVPIVSLILLLLLANELLITGTFHIWSITQFFCLFAVVL